MKKISRTIAMVLVLVMLGISFTSCLSYVYREESTPLRIVYAVVDIVFLPISLIALLIYVIINDASDEMDAQIFLANVDHDILPEYYLLLEKIYSLPEAELASLMQILNSIPKVERISSVERFTSLPEAERFSLINAYSSLPETEIISSMERINSLSETERVSLLRDFNSLSEADLASVIEDLRGLSNTRFIAAANYSQDSGDFTSNR